MNKTENSQKMLNWLESEKNKDKLEIEQSKQKYIKEIKGIKKEEMFPKPKKLTLWQRIKILILGN